MCFLIFIMLICSVLNLNSMETKKHEQISEEDRNLIFEKKLSQGTVLMLKDKDGKILYQGVASYSDTLLIMSNNTEETDQIENEESGNEDLEIALYIPLMVLVAKICKIFQVKL